MSKQKIIIEKYVDTVYARAENSSKKYNKGEVSFPYVKGYTESNLEHLLDQLNLTEEQLDVLVEYIDYQESSLLLN